jgi:hypothetical protein
MQSGGVLGIAGGKQRDVMTTANELFGDVRNDALGATIKLRRYALVQGRNLGDAETWHCGIVRGFRDVAHITQFGCS